MSEPESLSEWIRRARARSGLTQPQAAKAAGVGTSTWATWEAGSRYPLDRNAKGIAEALGVDYDAVYDRVRAERPPVLPRAT